VLDVTGPAGDQLIAMPIHLGKVGVTEGVEAMLTESARHFPVTGYTAPGQAEPLSSDISPLVSLVLCLCSQAAEIKETGAGKRVPSNPNGARTVPRRLDSRCPAFCQEQALSEAICIEAASSQKASA
jgi:hypothetical protein